LDLSVCLPLYTAGICWTLLYDTIYAHQDTVDDAELGIFSTAMHFGDNTHAWLSAFTAIMTTSLIASGIAAEQVWPYYAGINPASNEIVGIFMH